MTWQNARNIARNKLSYSHQHRPLLPRTEGASLGFNQSLMTLFRMFDELFLVHKILSAPITKRHRASPVLLLQVLRKLGKVVAAAIAQWTKESIFKMRFVEMLP